MKMDKRMLTYIGVLAAVVVLTVLVVMASRPEMTTPQGEYESEAVVTVLSSGDEGQPETMHLYQQYSKNVTIDTDIPADIPDSAGLIYAEAIDFDEQLLMSVFFNGEPLSEREKSSDGSYTYLELADGTYIGIDIGAFRYRSESGYMHLKLVTENLLTNSERAYIPSLNQTYGEIYQSKELEFMSSEAAISEVRKILEPLPITVSECTELYALDHETMQAYQDSYLEKHPDAAQNYTIKDVLTEEDDCYLICFRISQGDIPVTQYGYTHLADYRTVEGSVVKVFYSAKGIINISVTGAYHAKGVSVNSGDFISAEKAIELAIKTKLIAEDDVHITVINCCFEYVGVPYSKTVGEVLLTPAWNITVRMEGACETVHINASTGEVIK